MSVSKSEPRTVATARRRAASNPLRAAYRTAALFAVSLFLLGCWVVVKAAARDSRHLFALAAHWTRRWVRWCCRAAGVRVTVRGPQPAEGSLIAPNHIGYVDVLAVGAAAPCFFVAKVDVESWPFIGLLFRISRNIGVPRSRARALRDVTREIADRLRSGQSVCVFLEGTSTGGDRLLPFYPPLAQPAIDADAPLVPVALQWSSATPDVDVAEDIAYWKDHAFGPHAWRLLGLKGIRCDVTFGDPIAPAGHTRKTLAAAAQAAVATLSGLRADPPA